MEPALDEQGHPSCIESHTRPEVKAEFSPGIQPRCVPASRINVIDASSGNQVRQPWPCFERDPEAIPVPQRTKAANDSRPVQRDVVVVKPRLATRWDSRSIVSWSQVRSDGEGRSRRRFADLQRLHSELEESTAAA